MLGQLEHVMHLIVRQGVSFETNSSDNPNGFMMKTINNMNSLFCLKKYHQLRRSADSTEKWPTNQINLKKIIFVSVLSKTRYNS